MDDNDKDDDDDDDEDSIGPLLAEVSATHNLRKTTFEDFLKIK